MAGTASLIDQHRYIVLLGITSASPAAWSPDTGGSDPQPMLRRAVDVSARVLQVLKSPTDHRVPNGLKLQVVQRKPESSFLADDYGPWSEIDLVSGSELLVFASEPKPGTPIEQTLAEGSGLLVKVPDTQTPYAVNDVERVLDWEKAAGRHMLESEQIRRSIDESRAASGPLMAGHLAASIAGEDLADPKTMESHRFLLALLSAQDVHERFRLVILNHEVNELLMSESPPVWFRAELIAAMLHLLEEEKAELLHGPIRQAYLANAVFDAAGKPVVSAHDVVSDDAQRTAFSTVLEQRGFEPAQQTKLIRWLKAE